MEEFAKSALEQGVVGAIALMFGFLYLNERKENKKLREEAVIAAAKATPQGQADAFSLRVEAMAGKFAESLLAMDKTHHDQEDELTNRLIKTTESFSEKNGQLIEKVTSLAGSVKKHLGE